MKPKWFWGLLLAILLLAACLRLCKLGSVPQGLYIDEIAMLVDAKSVSQSGLDMHGRPWYQVMYPSYGDYKLPMYLWLASISVKLFGVSDFALRLPSALAGIATVLVAGLVTRELIADKKLKDLAQLSTMLVVAITPWSIMFSRTGFEGHVGQLLLAISVWLALASRRRWWLVIPSAVIGGLATYSYFSVRFVWPVVFSLISILFLVEWTTKRAHIKDLGKQAVLKLIMPLILFGLMLLPMVRSPLYADSNRFRLSTDSVLTKDHLVIDSNVYRELAGNTFIDRVLFHRWWLTTRELLLNYSDNLSPQFLFISGDPNLRHGTGEHGLFLWPMLPLLLLGGWFVYGKQKRVAVLLGVWWLAALLPASVPDSTPHALRSLNALVPISILMGIGLTHILASRFKLLKVAVVGCLTIAAVSFSYHYFHYYAADSALAWQQGYEEVVDHIYAQHDYDHLYILPFDERFYLWMMAYGPQTAVDFHQWQSQHFMFKQRSDVTFDNFTSWQSVPGNGRRVMIAGRVEQVEEVLRRTDTKLIRKQVVTNLLSQDVYTVAVIEAQ